MIPCATELAIDTFRNRHVPDVPLGDFLQLVNERRDIIIPGSLVCMGKGGDSYIVT